MRYLPTRRVTLDATSAGSIKFPGVLNIDNVRYLGDGRYGHIPGAQIVVTDSRLTDMDEQDQTVQAAVSPALGVSLCSRQGTRPHHGRRGQVPCGPAVTAATTARILRCAPILAGGTGGCRRRSLVRAASF